MYISSIQNLLERNILYVSLNSNLFYSSQEGSESKVVNEIAHATISSLYVLMALHIEGLQASSAGNIVGIGGLDNVVFKIATLSNLPFCPTFSPIQFKVTYPPLNHCSTNKN